MSYRLYSYWRSSSAWRVRIGLALKGLPYEYVAVNLLEGEQFSDAHQARSPLAQVPVLEVEERGHVLRLAQSMAILEWLDERHPTPPLLPRDLDRRAEVRALAEHVNSGIQPLQNAAPLKMLREKEAGYDKVWARHWIARGLTGLERAAAATAGRYSGGDEPGLADCYLVPQLYNARRFGIDLAPFPTLRRIEEACGALPAFQAAHPDRQPDAPPPEKRTP
ncbi:MAG: maleylacetoacetate isomerase [Anaeromyxobacter sp.]